MQPFWAIYGESFRNFVRIWVVDEMLVRKWPVLGGPEFQGNPGTEVVF